MQRKDLALRVLSTAAIISIVTSIAAPAFAGTYYIGKGSIDVEAITSTDGKQYVKVTQGETTYTDTSDEIVIKDGTDEGDTTLKDAERAAASPAADPAATHATQKLEAAGLEDAAGESQPDPDAGFTLNETKEGSAQARQGKDTPKPPQEGCGVPVRPGGRPESGAAGHETRSHHLCEPYGRDPGGHSGRRSHRRPCG